MAYLIEAIAFANGEECPHAGQYVESFDFEYNDGQGYGTFTSSRERAKKFGSLSQAMDFWDTQSKVKPLRDDGKPNKPLTALTVAIAQYDDLGDMGPDEHLDNRSDG